MSRLPSPDSHHSLSHDPGTVHLGKGSHAGRICGHVVSCTTILVTTAAHDARTVDVVVTNPGGQSSRLTGGTSTLHPSPLIFNGTWQGDVPCPSETRHAIRPPMTTWKSDSPYKVTCLTSITCDGSAIVTSSLRASCQPWRVFRLLAMPASRYPAGSLQPRARLERSIRPRARQPDAPPRDSYRAPLQTRRRVGSTIPVCLFTGLLQSGRPLAGVMAMTLVTLVLIQFFNAYNCRSDPPRAKPSAQIESWRRTQATRGSRGARMTHTVDNIANCGHDEIGFIELDPMAALGRDDVPTLR